MLCAELSNPATENNVPKAGVPMARRVLSRITLYEQLADPVREMPVPANEKGHSNIR